MQEAAASILHQAAFHGLDEVAKSLLQEHKQPPDVRNEHGQTPLMWAARRRQLQVATLLVQAGADVNCVDNSGSSALHHACSLQQADMVRFLIVNKADVSVTDRDGATAIQLANEDTMLSFMEAVLEVQRQFDGPGGAYEQVGSPSARGQKNLSPVRKSPRQSPGKLRRVRSNGRINYKSETVSDEVIRDDNDARVEQFSRHHEHIPLEVYDGDGAMPGDLFICVEHCFDCSCHGMSLRHNQQRVFAFRLKPTAPTRLGALEVTIAFKTKLRCRSRDYTGTIDSFGPRTMRETWLTNKLYSKLSNLNWPRPKKCRDSFIGFLWELQAMVPDDEVEFESPGNNAGHGQQLDSWMLRIGVDEGGHNVSQVRSAYKASNDISDDKSEPRGFLTLLGLAWSSSRGAHTVDERGDSRDITSHLLSDSNPMYEGNEPARFLVIGQQEAREKAKKGSAGTGPFFGEVSIELAHRVFGGP